MKHLMSPLDFSVEELDKLLDLANDIEKNPKNTHIHAMTSGLPLYFMSQAHVHV